MYSNAIRWCATVFQLCVFKGFTFYGFVISSLLYSFLYCTAFFIIILPLMKHPISFITFLCSSTELAITVLRSSLWWGHESDLHVRWRDHFHSTGYLLTTLSCSTVLALRPQSHQYDEKWRLSPHISSVWGLDGTESHLTSMAVSWRHFSFRFKKSPIWCCHSGATQCNQYDGVCLLYCICWKKLIKSSFVFIKVYSVLRLYYKVS